MNVLAIDTSTAITAVAVLADNVVRAEDNAATDQKHGDVVLPRVQAVLAAAGLTLAEIDLIAVGVGPGSFTGLRVGLATVKGLGFALQKPVRGVSSPLAIALAALERAPQVVVLLDAFKGEVYAGVFRRGADGSKSAIQAVPLFHASPSEAAARALAVLDPASAAIVCGDGVRRYEAEIMPLLGAGRVALGPAELDAPRGARVAELALRDFGQYGPSDLATLEPTYVRGSDARLPDRPLAVE
jgi:tRNA threonylcarbamoyladenosine biosynthesis protein TsaB